MVNNFKPKYRIITISGKIAVGTTTLTKNLVNILGWKHVNVGAIQREYDRKNSIHENMKGALSRSDKHENEIDNMTQEILKKDKNIIYEGWLSGFFAREYKDVLKVLVICSHDTIRVDRVANRDNITIEEAKKWIKNREEENITKWKKLYGNHDFWKPDNYDLVINTYHSGQLETVGKVLDKIGFKGNLSK